MSPEAPVIAIFMPEVSRIDPGAITPAFAPRLWASFTGYGAGDQVSSAVIVVPAGEVLRDHS